MLVDLKQFHHAGLLLLSAVVLTSVMEELTVKRANCLDEWAGKTFTLPQVKSITNLILEFL